MSIRLLSLSIVLVANTAAAAGSAPFPPPSLPPPRVYHGPYCDYAAVPKKLPVGVPRALTSNFASLGDDAVTSYLDSDEEVAALMTRFEVSAKRWDDGWGAEKLPSADQDTVFGRLLGAFALLDVPPPPGHAGILDWAGDFVANSDYEFIPSCNLGEADGRATPFPPPARTLWSASTAEMKIYSRAALALHETRHTQGIMHRFKLFGSMKCGSGEAPPQCCMISNSCDEKFVDWGPNALQAAYLAALARADLSRSRSTRMFNKTQRLDMVQKANATLYGKYLLEPGFRYVEDETLVDFGLAGPNGDEYIHHGTNVADGGPATQPLPMASSDTSVCFLTSVAGKFRSQDEQVWIGKNDATHRWELDVQTSFTDAQSAISAHARCVQADAGAPFEVTTWGGSTALGSAEPTVVDMGLATDRTCFVMGVRGALQDSDQGVTVKVEDGRWVARLFSTHTTPGLNLEGKVGCIPARLLSEFGRFDSGTTVLISSARTVWYPDYPGDSYGTAFSVPDAAYCAISGIRGQFDGQYEWIEILPHHKIVLGPNGQEIPAGIDFPTQWMLKVNEDRSFHTVRGDAACFLRPGFVER